MREAKDAAEEKGKKGRPGRLQRAADALQAWARIPRPCRDALKRADPFRVDELEMRIMDFLETEVHSYIIPVTCNAPFVYQLCHMNCFRRSADPMTSERQMQANEQQLIYVRLQASSSHFFQVQVLR